jgi:hypothetical protein
MVPVLSGEVKEGEQSFPVLGQAGDRLLALGAVLGAVLPANTSTAAPAAAARVDAPYISRGSAFMSTWTERSLLP